MQLPAKLDIVVDALRRTGRLSAPEVRIGASVPPRGYRTTVRLVGDADGRPAFRLERAHETVAAAGCLIAHPGIASLLPSLRVTPGLEVTIRVSAATGEITARWDRHAGDVDGLPSGAGTGPKAFLTEHVGGVPFRVSAGSFFQSGPAGAALLVDAVRRAAPELESATTVLDAYAGVGLFAKAAAREASRLLTVETSRSAVSDCTHNLAGRHVRIERGEFGAWRPAASERIDVAIANPARSGLGRPGVGSVAATEAPVVALVSCDPVALARDAALLAKHGFRHAGSEVLDLFPHTHHVETVTRFVRV